MRHGKPQIDLEMIRSKRMSPNQLGQIIADYVSTDLDSTNLPSDAALSIAKDCSVSTCSDLLRARSSVAALQIDAKNIIDPIYRESALPYLKLKFPKLSFFSWAILFRLAWFMGFSKNGESIKEAKSRAKIGAKKLEHLANKNGSVLNVGHGIMNRLVVKELKAKGWRATECTGEKYWSYTVLENETLQANSSSSQ